MQFKLSSPPPPHKIDNEDGCRVKCTCLCVYVKCVFCIACMSVGYWNIPQKQYTKIHKCKHILIHSHTDSFTHFYTLTHTDRVFSTLLCCYISDKQHFSLCFPFFLFLSVSSSQAHTYTWITFFLYSLIVVDLHVCFYCECFQASMAVYWCL